MRAYGNGTDLIIDRDREAVSHGLLADRGLAPPLFARFQNGLLYGFIPGTPCKAQDLTKEHVWRAVARKLGEWHARVPISGISTNSNHTNGSRPTNGNGHHNGNGNGINPHGQNSRGIASRQPVPNIWSIMQKWIDALSTKTDKERARKEMLQQEMERSFHELDTSDDVFCHCDLLCANVIQLSPQAVTFIDYEYATPAPAVFDIANHFAEWAGYDCDYSMVPGPAVRRNFLQEYVASYSTHAGHELSAERLYDEVERYRGLPGLYWGIWALIQAKISEIDFNYSEYAEQRLGEYFAWRQEVDGSRQKQGKVMPLRERTWAGLT